MSYWRAGFPYKNLTPAERTAVDRALLPNRPSAMPVGGQGAMVLGGGVRQRLRVAREAAREPSAGDPGDSLECDPCESTAGADGKKRFRSRGKNRHNSTT